MQSKAFLIGDKDVNSEATTLYERLRNNIKSSNWSSITICSAYLTVIAAEKLVELFRKITTNKRLKVNIIVGSKDYFTQPEAIEVVLDFINNQREKNIEYNFVQPLDTRFHIKCYLFLGHKYEKLLIGSANLTNNGLESFGELLVEVSHSSIINQVVTHLDYYYKNSVLWHEVIKEYSKEYERNAPKFCEEAYQKYTSIIVKKRIKKSKSFTIRLTSPTIDELYLIEKDKAKQIASKLTELRKNSLGLAYTTWILFEDMPYEEVKSMYPIGSWFDRPEVCGQSWNIGTKRMLSRVGNVISLNENDVILVMKKGSTHYIVSKEILVLAERLGIKTENDEEEIVPRKKDFDKYRNFIINNRKSLTNL